MKPSRALLAVLTIGSLLVAPVTAQAKKCPFLADASGDAHAVVAVGPAAPAFDILGFDIATGKKSLVAALHLASTDVKNDRAATLGINWTVTFYIGLTRAQLTRTASMSSPTSNVTYSDTMEVGNTAVAGGKVSMDAKNIVWTLPRKAVRPLTKGATMDQFFAQATSLLAHDYLPDNGSPSPAKYVDRQAGCVAAA